MKEGCWSSIGPKQPSRSANCCRRKVDWPFAEAAWLKKFDCTDERESDG